MTQRTRPVCPRGGSAESSEDAAYTARSDADRRVTALYIAALICGLIDEAQTLGRSILGYAVIVMAIGLLWGRLG